MLRPYAEADAPCTVTRFRAIALNKIRGVARVVILVYQIEPKFLRPRRRKQAGHLTVQDSLILPPGEWVLARCTSLALSQEEEGQTHHSLVRYCSERIQWRDLRRVNITVESVNWPCRGVRSLHK